MAKYLCSMGPPGYFFIDYDDAPKSAKPPGQHLSGSVPLKRIPHPKCAPSTAQHLMQGTDPGSDALSSLGFRMMQAVVDRYGIIL